MHRVLAHLNACEGVRPSAAEGGVRQQRRADSVICRLLHACSSFRWGKLEHQYLHNWELEPLQATLISSRQQSMLRQAISSLTCRTRGSPLCPALTRYMASQTENGHPVEVRMPRRSRRQDPLRPGLPDHTIIRIRRTRQLRELDCGSQRRCTTKAARNGWWSRSICQGIGGSRS